jgi:hypothetical protein
MNVPHPPYDDLRSAAGEDAEALAALDDLRASMNAEKPDPPTIAQHVDRLRGVKDAQAHVAEWYESPAVQRWLSQLSGTGL